MGKNNDGKKKSASGCGALLVIGFLMLLFLHSPRNTYEPQSAVEFSARYRPDLASSIGERDTIFALPGNAVYNNGDRASGNVSVQLLASDNVGVDGGGDAAGTPLAKIDLGVIAPSGYGPAEPRVAKLVDPWMSKVAKQISVTILEDDQPKRQIDLGTYEVDPERWARASQRPHCLGVAIGVVVLALAGSCAVVFFRHRRWGGWPEFLVWIPVLILAILTLPVLGRYCLLASFVVMGKGTFAHTLWLLCLTVGGGLLFAGSSLIASARQQGWLPAKYLGAAIQVCITVACAAAIFSFHRETIAPTRSAYHAEARSSVLPPSSPDDTSPESQVPSPDPAIVEPDSQNGPSPTPAASTAADEAAPPK